MKRFFQSINTRSTFYQFMIWGNSAAWTLFLITALLLSTEENPGNMGNIGLVIFILPAYLFALVDFIVIPTYLIKRLRRKDRSDVTVQILSFMLLLFIIAYAIWGGKSGS